MEVKLQQAPFELLRDWQRTQTQSSVTAARPETANGCPVLRKAGTTPRGTHASCEFWHMRFARSSEARVRRTVFSLDKRLTWMSAMLRLASMGVAQAEPSTPNAIAVAKSPSHQQT